MVVQIKSEKDIRDGLKKRGISIITHSHLYVTYDVFPSFNIEMFKYCNSVINVRSYGEKEIGHCNHGGIGYRDGFITIEDKIKLIR